MSEVVLRSRPSRAGRSSFLFGFWVLACGLSLALASGLLLRIAGITASSDIMLRVFGTVLGYMAFFYLVACRHGGYVVLFTLPDALGALWTALALRADQRAAGREPRGPHTVSEGAVSRN